MRGTFSSSIYLLHLLLHFQIFSAEQVLSCSALKPLSFVAVGEACFLAFFDNPLLELQEEEEELLAQCQLCSSHTRMQ